MSFGNTRFITKNEQIKQGFAPVVILLGIIIITVMGLLFWQVTQNAKEKKAPTGSISNAATSDNQKAAGSKPTEQYSQTINWEDVKLSDDDAQRRQDIQSLALKMTAYKVGNGSYPANAAAADTMQVKNSINDPETNLPYKFVDALPGPGQVQYKLSASCDNLNRNLTEENSGNLFALVIRLSEGSYICKSNIN